LGVGPGERSELLEEFGWLPLGEMAGLELLRPKRRMAVATGGVQAEGVVQSSLLLGSRLGRRAPHGKKC
jgi:hypothetical protein